ncbi:glycosyltransferase [Belnapia sp. T18]|uniref:Glycosyltransferase n=1 Tax=Belnapia arida TaxID=2804533 RepID=A0ABS1TYD3_9PROT|nr:glycosyltransferase [Belnapia arida]MBL6077250.1 glycosyltransferase [Belnapia arida]
MDRPPLLMVSPLPPARNGIADYAAALLPGLAAHYDCAAAVEDWLAEAPAGIPVVDLALAHRLPGDGRRRLYQIGNNPGHDFVLQALRARPGVTTLHDPGLLHLYESTGEDRVTILAGMRHAAPGLAATYARHLRERGVSTRANHLLFDLAGEVLARSRAVIVHSRFARARLRLTHGEAATAHVEVIPHLLPPGRPPVRAEARARLGIGPEEFLLVTAGFASLAKRLDWVLAALEGLPALRWIHAGEVPAALAPRIGGRARITGHLPADEFDAHIAAADVLVNLRFPSAGESSGSLARALAAGTCCIVSRTGAFAELPGDAVIALPLAGGAPALAEALAALAAAPERARAIGGAGRAHAEAEMALPAVAARYRAAIEAAEDRPPPRAEPTPLLRLAADRTLIAAALAGRTGACRLCLGLEESGQLAALSLAPGGLAEALLPPGAELRAARLEGRGLVLDLQLPA